VQRGGFLRIQWETAQTLSIFTGFFSFVFFISDGMPEISFNKKFFAK